MEIIEKFQDLLRALFQFETSDLDFGIYRILNYKREQIERFIEKDLVNKVESAFAKHKDERLSNIRQQFEKVKEDLLDTAKKLGKEPLALSGEVKEEFGDSELGKKYQALKQQKDEAETIDEIKIQVFNDLYSFLSRYYEEGDFAPQYRYSIKRHKYAIPYNGEEVKLYWANNEQYYTKTGLLFRDYAFRAGYYRIVFRIVSAKEELGSKKATKERFFVLDDENLLEQIDDGKSLVIRFQYRELSEKEVKGYQVEGGSNVSKQNKINQKSYEEVLREIEDIQLKAQLGKEYKGEKPLLLYQLSRFTAKNTMDYFIHRNLKGFLSEQLDYFIKAEVLSIDTLEKERFLDKHITRAKVVREIGQDIIDFLSQIEDFQKRLWEKKKFVLKTEYVITTDRVPEEFHARIWKSADQRKEWKDLGFDEPKSKEDLKKRKLPIDTKYFSKEFKEELLEKLTDKADLDDLLDGLLIKSENWQALNLLRERYQRAVKCIYIDPPFNSKTTEILYRNIYKHSSWLALMQNRISGAKQVLEDHGVFICAVDENEQERLGMLLGLSFPTHGKTCVTVIHNPGGIQGENFSYCHEYVYFVFPSGGTYIGRFQRDEGDTRPLRDWGGEESKRETARNCFYPIYVKNEAIISFGEVCPDDFHPKASNIHNEDGTISIYPVDSHGVERKWRYARQSVEKIRDDLFVENAQGERVIKMRKAIFRYKTVWTDKKYNSNAYGSRLLSNMFGEDMSKKVSFPKSIYNVRDCLHATTQHAKNSIIMDYFAGSGTTAHAVMKLNQDDKGRRKFILVEMADYFDAVMIPRIKKVAHSYNWSSGRPQNTDGSGVFFKYQFLEQYEDTLDNIEPSENKQARLKFGEEDYLLKYFLDYETKKNPSLLNIEHLKDPFAYKLKVNLAEVGEPQELVIDIPETFNYLLGLKVKRMKVRHYGRKYLFIFGEKGGKNIAIVWRKYDDKWSEDDFKKEREFIIKEIEPWAPHIVYINGQSVITPKLGEHTIEVHYVEPEFKKLMS